MNETTKDRGEGCWPSLGSTGQWESIKTVPERKGTIHVGDVVDTDCRSGLELLWGP
jgi:hypothetical protein